MKDIFEKVFTNPSIVMMFVALLLILTIVTTASQFWNPFAPSGQVVGIFIEGYHEGFGEFCGQYPNSGIRFCNETYNKEHFYGGNWFYFGNQYKGIDKMIEGKPYCVWYHQESRPSDTTSGNNIYYWVIDDIKPLTCR